MDWPSLNNSDPYFEYLLIIDYQLFISHHVLIDKIQVTAVIEAIEGVGVVGDIGAHDPFASGEIRERHGRPSLGNGLLA